MHEEGDSLDDWLDRMKELLRGTRVNFKSRTITSLSGSSKEGKLGVLRHLREEWEGGRFGYSMINKSVTDVGGAEVLGHGRRHRYLDFRVTGQGEKSTPSIVDKLI